MQLESQPVAEPAPVEGLTETPVILHLHQAPHVMSIATAGFSLRHCCIPRPPNGVRCKTEYVSFQLTAAITRIGLARYLSQ